MLTAAVTAVTLLAGLGCGARQTLAPAGTPAGRAATASATTGTVQATPTASATPAGTATPSGTATPTATASATATATASASATATATAAAKPAPPPLPPAPLPAETPAPRPTGAMAVVIGNDPAARPQSGLDLADVIWEIPAEGYITRYLAIFASRGSNTIGPVRSSRIYFDQLAKAYGIPFAHAGGNVDALNWIATWHLPSLDAIYGAGGDFWRYTARVAPENLYTSTALLNAGARARGFTPARLTLPASTAARQTGSPAAGVSIDYITNTRYTYHAGWRWEGGRWVRTINGATSYDASGSPITAQTVVVLTAVQAPDPDPHTTGAIQFLWSRGGTAWVLRDGTSLQGQWRLGPQGLPVVTGGSAGVIPVGKGLPLWFEVVPAAWQVSIAP